MIRSWAFLGKTVPRTVFLSSSIIQPDWWEVTVPGVATNRYAYAGGDPVNGSDPGGNGFWSDVGQALKDSWNAFVDGLTGNVTKVGPHWGGHVHINGTTYNCAGCGGTGADAVSSVMRAASASAGVSADGCFSGCLFGGGQNKPIESFSYANATFIAANPNLELFAGDPQLEAQFLNMLELGLYLIGDADFMHEVSAYGLYNPNSGKMSFVPGNYPESSGPGWTAMPVLPKIANGTIVIAMHTHPATGHYFTNQSGKRVYGLGFPSEADIALAGSSGIPGMVVTGGGVIYGYDGAGYQ